MELSGNLLSMSVKECLFLLKRAFHLDYTKMGRFSDLIPDNAEKSRLAEIHEFYRKVDPRTVVQIHGIAPRSGTNYILDLLRDHPQIGFDQNALPEFPLLSVAIEGQNLQRAFLNRYAGNARSMNSLDMISHSGHGLLYHAASARDEPFPVFKVPHVHHLNLFRHIFPSHKLIICTRDGRDVVESSVRTWKGKGFARRSFRDYCREWARAAEIILDETAAMRAEGFDFKLIKYEEAFEDPAETARALCGFVGCDPAFIEEDTYDRMSVRGSSQAAELGDLHWGRDNIKRDDSFRPIGRWRQSWSAAQKSEFHRIAGNAMQQLGYDCS